MRMTLANEANAPEEFLRGIEQAFAMYDCLGCSQIAAACNQRRLEIMAQAAREGNFCGYCTDLVHRELGPQFCLLPFAPVNIKVAPGVSKENAERPAEYDESTHTITIYFERFEKVGDLWRWTGFSEDLSQVVWHELLHACGDLLSRGRTDGLLRHKCSGADVIRELVKQASP